MVIICSKLPLVCEDGAYFFLITNNSVSIHSIIFQLMRYFIYHSIFELDVPVLIFSFLKFIDTFYLKTAQYIKQYFLFIEILSKWNQVCISQIKQRVFGSISINVDLDESVYTHQKIEGFLLRNAGGQESQCFNMIANVGGKLLYLSITKVSSTITFKYPRNLLMFFIFLIVI